MILKLKRTPGIYLMGFMGSGKTTIGCLLAQRIGWRFVDLDAEIEAAEKMSIREIFETRGEDEFRKVERERLRENVRAIECGRPTVIALGGGAVAHPAAYELVSNNGVTIWLDCPFETVRRRTEPASHRPLARDPVSFALLYQARLRTYEQADFRIPIESDDPNVTVEAALCLPLFK